MKNKKSILYYSLLAAVSCVPVISHAGIRVGNLSRTNAQGYQQVNEMRYNAAANNAAAMANTVAAIPADLPVPVDNPDLAAQVRSAHADSPVSMAQLERCSMIYPNGEFKWATPTVGRGAGGASTCTAVVELRAYQAGQNGEDLVVARANLPAGEAIRCNISDFPEVTWQPAAEQVEFPADHEPTMDDVVAVMNREQKQDAGFKIAAGAILGGLGGNAMGKNEPGKDGILGGGKHKTQSTIIGALGGAALMVGHTQTGKVAGDTILSAGVNATAGAVVGNMVATGDAVMRIEDCTVDGRDTTCLWGIVATVKEDGLGTEKKGDEEYSYVGFYHSENESTIKCLERDGKYTNCVPQELISICLDESSANIECTDLDKLKSQNYPGVSYYTYVTEGYNTRDLGNHLSAPSSSGPGYIKIKSAKIADKKEPAMIVGVKDSAFGHKRSDWASIKKNIKNEDIYLRSTSNQPYRPDVKGQDPIVYDIQNFYPMYRDAEDGALIDFGNKARLKSTLTGAGVGGALGAFAGYQGAQQDVEERWVTAVREYKDSLQKFYCATGTRFLTQYNDLVTIPALILE